MLNRYIRTIQIQRQDFNGRMLTIRKDDVRAIACILGVATERTLDRLDQLGLCRAGASEPLGPELRRLPPRPVLLHPLRLLRVRELDRTGPPGQLGRASRRERVCEYGWR